MYFRRKKYPIIHFLTRTNLDNYFLSLNNCWLIDRLFENLYSKKKMSVFPQNVAGMFETTEYLIVFSLFVIGKGLKCNKYICWGTNCVETLWKRFLFLEIAQQEILISEFNVNKPSQRNYQSSINSIVRKKNLRLLTDSFLIYTTSQRNNRQNLHTFSRQ